MNMCFLYDGKLLTSPLHGTILDGITRRSVLTLAHEMGLKVEERALTVEEIFDDAERGLLTEAFGTGTQKLYDTLTGIQYGRLPDPHGWVELL